MQDVSDLLIGNIIGNSQRKNTKIIWFSLSSGKNKLTGLVFNYRVHADPCLHNVIDSTACLRIYRVEIN